MIFKIFLFIILIPFAIYSQKAEVTNKTEFGFWMGASNPLPGSPTSKVLSTSLGFGLYTRFPFPFNKLLTEIGGGYSNFLSKTDRGLQVMPIYVALDYKLPFELPVAIYLKGGGGGAYVIARPNNSAKWDPAGFLGSEVSFTAGRKVRIGLRVDYYKIFETTGTHKPPIAQYLFNSPTDDSRLYNPQYYQLHNADFFHFNLMVGFLF